MATNHPRRHPHLDALWFGALLIGLAAGGGGCVGGQSGGELGADDGTGGGGNDLGTGGSAGADGGLTGETGLCTEATTELALDETSPLGFSADDVLAFAAGEHEAALEYDPGSSDNFTLSVGDDTTLTLTVEPTGSATFVDSAPESFDSGGLMIDIGSDCPDRIAIDVVVTISTADGAFAEQLPGVLNAEGPTSAELTVPLDLDALDGTFAVEVVSPENAVPVRTSLSATFGPGLFAGEVSGNIEMRDENVAMAMGGLYAEWGYGSCTEGFPVDPGAEGAVSADDLLAVIEEHSPLVITWGDGSSAALTLTATGEDPTVCRQPADTWLGVPEDRYRLAAELTLASDDGRLETTQPIAVEAVLGDDGALATVRLTFASAWPVAPEDFAARYGLADTDLGDATEAFLSLELAYDVSGGSATADGALTVLGLLRSDCVDTPNSTCGSPGPQPLETAPITLE
jgi:hypothetical protein